MATAVPDIPVDDMVARAVELRPALLAAQAEVEQRTYYSEEMHRAFLDGGFYRMYVPRRYGGLEYDVPSYARVVGEVARGCPSTGWCMALGAAHALQVGSWYEEAAQAELFGDGDFRCSAVATPVGVAKVTEGGYELNGTVAYCSGLPYATHYMGQAFAPPATPDGPPGPSFMFVAPRSEWTMLDDWGDMLGLKGSGSHSVHFEGGVVPHRFVLEDTVMTDVDVDDGTPGLRLHGNPLYGSRSMGPFTMTLAAVLIGAAYCALDEYEELLRTRRVSLPPFTLRMDDPDYQRWFGSAIGRLATAEAALRDCGEQHMRICERAAAGGAPFSYAEDLKIGVVAREAYMLAWEVMQDDIFRTAGSSATRAGTRIERVFRDMSMGSSHRNTLLRDFSYRIVARDHLGIPRDETTANVQRL